MTLKDIQKQFIDFIYSNKEFSSAKKDIISPSFEDSMMIYRRHVWFSLINTLETHYESVLNLLGDKLFLKVAKEYVSKHPSNTPDLELYGFKFPEFLRKNKSISRYSSDLATIDISYVKASIAEDFEINTFQEFQNIKQDDYEKIIFHVNPTNIICNLRYDVIHYFEHIKSTQKDKTTPQIGAHENIIITNRNSDNNIQHQNISSLELEFLNQCNKGEKFINIFEKLYKIDQDINLQKILSKLIENQLIIKFTIN